jgi:hypothetical protein
LDILLEKLDAKLKEWKPETVAEVRHRVAEMIALADQDALDLMRSRALKQEVRHGTLTRVPVDFGLEPL